MRKQRFWYAAAAATVLLAAGCNGGADNQPSPTPTPTVSSPTASPSDSGSPSPSASVSIPAEAMAQFRAAFGCGDGHVAVGEPVAAVVAAIQAPASKGRDEFEHRAFHGPPACEGRKRSGPARRGPIRRGRIRCRAAILAYANRAAGAGTSLRPAAPMRIQAMPERGVGKV